MANTSKFYVTFYVWEDPYNKKKIAVECENDEQVHKCAYDIDSLNGTGNIRLRKCNRPSGRQIISYKDYWRYNLWY